MDVYYSLSFWLFQPKFWIILGVVLILIDIFLASFFLLPIGISSLILSIILYVEKSGLWTLNIFSTWRDVLIWFAAISLLSVFLMKLFSRNRDRNSNDINDY